MCRRGNEVEFDQNRLLFGLEPTKGFADLTAQVRLIREYECDEKHTLEGIS
jgi:hypothetical protein